MKTIRVQGKGKALSEPDMIVLQFGIETNELEYEAAINELNRRTQVLRTQFEGNGIDIHSLRTASYSIDVDTKYNDGEYVFNGYSANHALKIELPNEKRLLNSLLRDIAKSESGARIRISFTVKDKEQAKKRALEAAVENAKNNASILANSAGVKLGAIEQIEYGYSEMHIYDHQMNMVCEESAEESRFEADIEPAEVSAEDSVTIIYGIEA
jgi:hypothetical protein